MCVAILELEKGDAYASSSLSNRLDISDVLYLKDIQTS